MLCQAALGPAYVLEPHLLAHKLLASMRTVYVSSRPCQGTAAISALPLPRTCIWRCLERLVQLYYYVTTLY